MKTHALRLAAVSFSVFLAAATALRADAIYVNSATGYSVTVHDSSTIFNTTAGFNGNRTDFGGSWGSQYVGGGATWSGTQSFSATFQANPGSVFTGAYINFGQWSFAVPEGSYVELYMDWSLPGAVYTGSDHTPLYDPYGHGGVYWDIGEGGGVYRWKHAINQGGGGFGFMSFMDFSSLLLLDNVSSFTMSFNLGIAHGGNTFGDNKGAGLGFSDFQVAPTLKAGEPKDPPTATVPETGATAILLGAGLLGLLGASRRLKMNPV
ncbi:MAG: hypothetical protein QG602_1210 [Verrucomicrobiota bacterium]|nr:hypothetical protein [Verrucomicrobiota bacterium]